MLELRSVALCYLHFILCCALLHSTRNVTAVAKELTRHDFPQGFIFGAGTSAYQVEGAAFEDGRTPSSADTHAGIFPDNGDVACDQYHRYKEDVQLMVETGLDAYRFSISWSRLIPNGRGPVNRKGLEYYNNLINELVSHGIQPHVTLLHLDVPVILEDEYGGFSNPSVVKDFTAYADVCFREFGDRVRHWTSINEANIFAYGGDPQRPQHKAPHTRCHSPNRLNCTTGSYDPFLIGHHMLLAHASATRLYKEKYQAKQHGFIGFSLHAFYFIPFSNSTQDTVATQRTYTFFIDWMMHPLLYGDYPKSMKNVPGVSLPVFSDSEKEVVKGTIDYIGLNYYASIMVKDNPSSPKLNAGFPDYMDATWLYLNDTNPLQGDPMANTPWGLQGVLEHFKHVYDNPPILIHENGQLTDYNTTLSTSVDDPSRVEYLSAHIQSLLDSVRNGSNVIGYFAWSFLDVYEFLYGYKQTFGIYYVDFNDINLGRYPKLSQKWYSRFLKGKNKAIAAEKGSQEENEAAILEFSPQDGTTDVNFMSLKRD